MENTQNAIQVELSLQILSSDVHSMSAAIVLLLPEYLE